MGHFTATMTADQTTHIAYTRYIPSIGGIGEVRSSLIVITDNTTCTITFTYYDSLICHIVDIAIRSVGIGGILDGLP